MIKLYALEMYHSLMSLGLRERVLKVLSEAETLHARDLLRKLDISVTVLKPLMEELVRENLVERFSHGGYTFYRITEEGKGLLIQIEKQKEIEGLEERAPPETEETKEDGS